MPQVPEVPKVDIFDSPLVKEEPKPVKLDDEKKETVEKKPEFDVATHPVVVELNKKVQDYSTNLKNQGDIIDKQSRDLKELKKASKQGKPAEEDKPPALPYDPASIKRSKSLTEAEREEMTAGEIAAMDKLADAQEAANKLAKDSHEKAKASKKAEVTDDDDDEEEDDKKVTEVQKMVNTEVARLAEGNAERLRELNEAVKLITFEGLKTPEEVAARVKLASSMIPNYVPPKEQQTAIPAPVKAGGGADDPHNVDQIIRDAKKTNNGTYSL